MSAMFRFMDGSLRAKMGALLVVASLLPLAIAAFIDIRDARRRLLANTVALLAALRDGKWEGIIQGVRKDKKRISDRVVVTPCLVLNLWMPDGDNFDFLQRFRELPKAQGVPVIVWTGKDLSNANRRRLESSAQGIVPKGQGSDQLLKELETHLPRRPAVNTAPEEHHAR